MSLFLLALLERASAQTVPRRQIPPSVLTELDVLQNRFGLALAEDCHPQRCYSKGCTYLDHAVVERPRPTAMPGLDPTGQAPGTVVPQEFLTRASCAFAYEPSVTVEEADTLARRLQSKMSGAFTVVSVTKQELQLLPPELRERPVPETPAVPETPPPPVPEPWTLGVAARELWTTLLPHFAWMIAVVMVTVAGTVLVWAFRRVGKESAEEQALLAQMLRADTVDETDGDAADQDTEEAGEDDAAYVAHQAHAWDERLAAAGGDPPDRELQALVRDLLRTRDLPLLAKAVLRFPESFLATFPVGGDLAAAKLELSEYLKTVDVERLPSDADFFRSLNRHARSATLAAQSDAQLVRSLREDFGAVGLVGLVRELPDRAAGLLFALAPAEEQQEMVRLLSHDQAVRLAAQLLRSNRMDAAESSYLFEVLSASRAGAPLPGIPPHVDVSDRGSAFDAAGALSVLLPAITPEARAALFGEAIHRFHGTVPAWYRGILVADMLLAISQEARADVLLEVDVETLAAWLSTQAPGAAEKLREGLPAAFRASVEAAVFPSRARQLALAERARGDLARGFQRQLAQAGVPFERVVQPRPSAEA